MAESEATAGWVDTLVVVGKGTVGWGERRVVAVGCTGVEVMGEVGSAAQGCMAMVAAVAAAPETVRAVAAMVRVVAAVGVEMRVAMRVAVVRR